MTEHLIDNYFDFYSQGAKKDGEFTFKADGSYNLTAFSTQDKDS